LTALQRRADIRCPYFSKEKTSATFVEKFRLFTLCRFAFVACLHETFSNIRNKNPRTRGLGLRIAVPFLFFVIAGSIALATLMQQSFQRESRALFTSLAQTNANFIRNSNLAEIIEKVGQTFSATAAHARVSIVQKIPRDIFIETDARRIAQAFGNIALNAIQAMPVGGILRIEADAKEKVTIHFDDTGCGFSENALAHFADLFFSEKEGGMGIGLSVASEIIRAHGGGLRVENCAGSGARVTVTLPRAMSAD
jgi:signal transduction histidine kinase